MFDRDKDLFHVPPEGQFVSGEQPVDEVQSPDTPWYHRPSTALAMAGVLVLGPIAGVSVYAAQKSGNEAGSAAENPDARTAPAGWDEKMAQAATARKAITERYASCEITNVTDTQTSEKSTVKVLDQQGFPVHPERVTRNEVHMTVRATITDAAMQAEQAYANGTPDAKRVQWYPFSLGASTDIIKQSSTGRTHRVPIPRVSKAQAEGNTETFSITMYPRTDRARTTSADVSLFTHVETYNPYQGDTMIAVTYEAVGRISCGAIQESLVDGERRWQLDPTPEVTIPRTQYSYRQCATVPIAGQPGSATEQCS